VVVYGFADGKITQEKLISLPLQALAKGRKTLLPGSGSPEKGIPFPAAIAVIAAKDGSEKLLVAGNLSDDVLLVNPADGKVEKTFDLSESDAVPGTFPIALAVTKDGKRAFVALWNASEVVELDLEKGIVGRKLALLKPADPIKPGTHPCALELSPDGGTMYVALANRDAVAAVHVGGGAFAVKGYFDTRLPRQSYFGAEPDALALNGDGSRLYVANAISDSIAVMDTTKLTGKVAGKGMVEPIGFVPTEWMPMSMAFVGTGPSGKLCVATAKGKGAGPNAALYVHCNADAWFAGHARCGGDGERPRAVDRGGIGVEPHEGGRGEDCLWRRQERSHQARDLHHQGEPHLRSDPWRPEEGRQAGGQRRPKPDHVWRGGDAKRAQAGVAVWRAG
jgi:sugar lactone lactonase YvrE